MHNAGAYVWGADVVHASSAAPISAITSTTRLAPMQKSYRHPFPGHWCQPSPCWQSWKDRVFGHFFLVVAIIYSRFGDKLACTVPFSQDNFGIDIVSDTASNIKMKRPVFGLNTVVVKKDLTPLLIFHGFNWSTLAIVLDTWSDSTSAHVYLSKTDLAVGAGVGLCNKIKQSGCNWWDYSLESSHCNSDFLSQWIGWRPVVRQGALGQEEH